MVVGLVADWLAGVVMHGSGGGIVDDIIIGIIGGLVGVFLASAVLDVLDAAGGNNIISIIVAFVNTVISIAMIRAVARPTSV